MFFGIPGVAAAIITYGAIKVLHCLQEAPTLLEQEVHEIYTNNWLRVVKNKLSSNNNMLRA